MKPPVPHQAPCELNARRPVSIRELFTIGIGPSSSHTVGPMRAAARFMADLPDGIEISSLSVRLYGSLALTGLGHHTDRAVILGLAGFEPESINPDDAADFLDQVRLEGRLPTRRHGTVPFGWDRNVVFLRRFVREHPNTLDVRAVFANGSALERRFQSIGGGAILEVGGSRPGADIQLSLPFSSGAELLDVCSAHGCSIADVVRANETAWRPAAETDQFVDDVCDAMMACIERGVAMDGVLPGGLGVRRRAGALLAELDARGDPGAPSSVFEWVSLWALAVNEENAAGGRVVTAPTNGAAGVLPAVLRYYLTFVKGADGAGARNFLYTAAAIGFLYKKRASISAAEMGCQGEVGVACSMAAAGLAAVMGATALQVENAAEIGMEHNLGLTCDPIGGLVQIPCIERNTMGAIKAINAALLALRGDGQHVVSLDQVIETMRQTGLDMRSRYKETSLGGLAVNVVEC